MWHPTIVWRPGSGCACHASLGALGKRWGSGRLVHYANVNSGKARPSSIIGSDTPRGRRSSLKSCATITVTVELVTAGPGCTSLYQHLSSPHTRTELCPHCAHHTTHSPFQAGSRATCGCERLHRGGGRRRGRKGGVNWSEDQDGAQGRGGGGGGQNRPQNLIQDSTNVGFPSLDDGRRLS